jgi:hypothetical protein
MITVHQQDDRRLLRQSSGRGRKSLPDALSALPTGWQGEAEVFAYWETPRECRLVHGRLSETMPPEIAFEGRLFNDIAEVRWVRRSDGYEAWLTREDPSVTPALGTAKRRYYLIGLPDESRTSSSGGRIFTEGRYPHEVVYPVGPPPSKDARAYIEVVEYRAIKPTWSALESCAEVDLADCLDQPLSIAHRFVGVGVGDNSEGGAPSHA